MNQPPASAEKLTQLVNEELKRCLDNAAEGLHWVGPDGTILWANQTELDLLGYTREEYVGHNIAEFHVDGPVIGDILARLTRGETLLNYEARLRHKDGSVRHVQINSNVLWRDDQFLHTRCFTRDITDRKAADELIRRLADVVENSEDAIISEDLGGTITSWNPAAERTYGYTADEAKDRSIRLIIPADREQEEADIVRRVRNGERVPPFDTVRQRKDRTLVDVSLTVSPIRDRDGRIVGASKASRDITEQVRARHQINELRETAEAANRSKDEFLAMLGHELRNPLSPILTALQLMKLRGGDALQRERDVIERQVKHLTRLVDDLLDVSRIARGKVELKEGIIEIAEVIATGIEMASPLLEERAHSLAVDVPRQGLSVKGDPMRLSQVVSNLVANAAKYTPAGGKIDIRARKEAENVVIRVRDTGVGISRDMLPRVFDLFVQGGQGLDRSQGGLGLGLTIVRNLIERHGGTVSAESRGIGRGSEFVVCLPRAEGTKHAPGRRDGPAPTAEWDRETERRRKILVVDDNQDGANMLADAFEGTGHETRVAYDAPTALAMAIDVPPDVAFIDLGLPGMNGYELAARLRQLPALASTRLIAVTGYGQDADRRKALSAGFECHLVKPVDLNEVLGLVGEG